MSILWELYNSYLKVAKTIPGFIEGSKEDVPYDITDLANKYCQARDAKDEVKKSQYLSALMVRYWHMVPYLYENSQNIRVSIEEVTNWLYEGIEKACYYRGWLDESMAVSKDARGAEKCINQCITSIRAYYFKHYNELKRKGVRETYSLDEILEDYQDTSCSSYLGTTDNYFEEFGCRDLVSMYINKKDVFTAIVVDLISFGDVMIEAKQKKTITDSETGETKQINVPVSQFSQAKLSHCLNTIDDNYINYFLDTYEVEKEEVVKVVSKIKKVSRMCLSKYIKDSISKLQRSKEVASIYGK